MDYDTAVTICVEHFPNGLERVADNLRVKVVFSEIVGCSGWCIRNSDGSALIRIRSSLDQKRQRSTLAHELGHIIGKTTPGIHRLKFNNTKSERRAFAIGNELLFPTEVVPSVVRDFPLCPISLKSVSDESRVSQTVAAIQISRFVNAAVDHDVDVSAVVGLKNRKPTWFPVKSFPGVKKVAKAIDECLTTKPISVARVENYIGFRIDAPTWPCLFIQRPASSAFPETQAEVIDQFALQHLVDQKIRRTVEGKIGYMKDFLKRGEAEHNAVSAAEEFISRYDGSWPDPSIGEAMASQPGREYLVARFSKWFAAPSPVVL